MKKIKKHSLIFIKMNIQKSFILNPLLIKRMFLFLPKIATYLRFLSVMLSIAITKATKNCASSSFASSSKLSATRLISLRIVPTTSPFLVYYK